MKIALTGLMMIAMVCSTTWAGGPALSASSTEVAPGETLDLIVFPGAPGAPVAFALVAVDGMPMVTILTIQSFDLTGEATLSSVVPPEANGVTFTLQAFGCNDPAQHSGVYQTNTVEIVVEVPPI